MIAQTFPWPGKLAAVEDSLDFEAKVLEKKIETLKLNIEAKIKKLVFRGFFLNKSLETNQAEKLFLSNLSNIALAKVKVGRTGQQDVVQASLEISRLEQENIRLKEQLKSTVSQLNSVLNRAPLTPITFPQSLAVKTINLDDDEGWRRYWPATLNNHPQVTAAKFKVESAKAQLRGAELKKYPNIKASVSWFDIDESKAMVPSNENADALAVGLSLSIPIGLSKYESVERSASFNKRAAVEKLQTIHRNLENDIADLWSQAQASKDILNIYKQTI